MRVLFGLVLALLSTLNPAPVAAHALDPGYLELSYLDQDRWRIFWRAPDVDGRPMKLAVVLPEACETNRFTPPAFDGRAWVTSGLASCPGGLAGGTLRIDGLEETRTDVLVRYELSPNRPQTQRLTPGTPEFIVPADPGNIEVLTSYVSLGVSHILEGVDHLLFVLALLLLVRDTRRLFWTVTAFTLAHSITLAAASLGWVAVPSVPVEVVIALSIVFLAYELALPPDRRDPLTERYPAIVSFGFGLIHGLGFAGALREIGLPQNDIPLALFSFNIGVEIGQLLFIGAALALGWALKRLLPALVAGAPALHRLTSYGIGSIAAFWVIERLSGF